MLGLHLALAERSLVQENPTVDEVVHLPAGVTYWQKHTFRLYHHNPPLIKLIAALPVVWANPITEPAYQQESWTRPDPSPTTFSQTFAFLNLERYFELFQLARMVMPLFSVLGGLVVFLWSRRLYGTGGGLLSLCLWVFCPNILAHCRLITTDVGSTAMGVAATFVFWLYLRKPSWWMAAASGIMLGLAQLSKFSMLLLLALWPFLWLVRLVLVKPRGQILRRTLTGMGHAFLVLVLCALTIDVCYLFEGVGIPLGRFEFASKTLTKPIAGGFRKAPGTRNPLYAMLWPFRENRFRGTPLAGLPVPLPEHYVLGFDEQKIEAEAIPIKLHRAGRALDEGRPDDAIRELNSADERVLGYPVYLDGELRESGWWYYYLLALVYKVPEGTWLLVLLSLWPSLIQRKTGEAWADEITLWTVPVVILFSMSFLTDINIGLRYVLAITPYVFIATGKVVPWVEGASGSWRQVRRALAVACLTLTVSASLWIHPHYLSYFNWASGGPDRMPAHLIDSNLDWGQDLVGLREWCRQNLAGEPIGLAYFGQINPTMFSMRGDSFDWFLPPVSEGTVATMPRKPGLPPPRLIGPANRLRPGYYAISASLVHGLKWRIYDPSPAMPDAWAPGWDARLHALSYFRNFPIHARIGHSIYIYRITQEEAEKAGPFQQFER